MLEGRKSNVQGLASKNRQKAVFDEYGRDGRVNWGFEPQRGEPVNAQKAMLEGRESNVQGLVNKNRQKAVFDEYGRDGRI